MPRSAQLGGAMLAAIILGCAQPTPSDLTDAQRAAVTDSILAITRGWADAANALDASRLASTITSDPELTFAADGSLLLIPHDSLISMYRSIYRGFRSMAFVWDTLRVSVLGPDAGVLSGAGHVAVTDTSGHTDRKGVAVTYVFARRGGRWQLLHGHASHRALP